VGGMMMQFGKQGITRKPWFLTLKLSLKRMKITVFRQRGISYKITLLRTVIDLTW